MKEKIDWDREKTGDFTTDNHNTWEPAPNPKNAPWMVKEFHKRHPAAPGPAHQEGA